MTPFLTYMGAYPSGLNTLLPPRSNSPYPGSVLNRTPGVAGVTQPPQVSSGQGVNLPTPGNATLAAPNNGTAAPNTPGAQAPAPGQAASPYASGFAGPSNDSSVFTTPGYSHDLNQNYQASMSNMGQAPAFGQGQFNTDWANLNQAYASGNGSAGEQAYNQNLGLGQFGLGGVTQNEQANPQSNLYQVPNVQQGQPYQHFMQANNFGTGVQGTYNGGASMVTQGTPYGGNTQNFNGGQQAPPGQPGGGGGQVSPGTPQTGTPNGGVPMSNTFNPGPNPLAPAQQTPQVTAGGFNQWGNQNMGNPYSYMTGQPNNGLNGGMVQGGPGGQWVPSSGAYAGNQAYNNQNPLQSNGTMNGYGSLLNNIMGINPFTAGGYVPPVYNVGAQNQNG